MHIDMPFIGLYTVFLPFSFSLSTTTCTTEATNTENSAGSVLVVLLSNKKTFTPWTCMHYSCSFSSPFNKHISFSTLASSALQFVKCNMLIFSLKLKCVLLFQGLVLGRPIWNREQQQYSMKQENWGVLVFIYLCTNCTFMFTCLLISVAGTSVRIFRQFHQCKYS